MRFGRDTYLSSLEIEEVSRNVPRKRYELRHQGWLGTSQAETMVSRVDTGQKDKRWQRRLQAKRTACAEAS